jgi:SPP1 family predicted phage head-tail adaptor
MIPAGRLRHRITLQSKETTRDVMGGEIITWVDVATVWAEVSALSGRALIAAQQAQSEITARIIVRKAAAGSIADDWRIKHGADIYTLHAIIPSDDGVNLNLQVSKGLKNG